MNASGGYTLMDKARFVVLVVVVHVRVIDAHVLLTCVCVCVHICG